MTTKHHNILRKILAVIGLAVMMFVFVPAPVYAQQPEAGQLAGEAITATDLGLYYGEATGLGTTDIRVTIARIIKIALSVLGIIAIVIVIAGGIVWMTAGGDDKKVALAKKILLNGVIGLAIILSAYAITSFVMKSLTEATTGVGEGGAGGDGGGGGFGGRGCANPPCAGNNFVAKISPKGQQRIQNVLVKITFSERGRAVAYDPASLRLGENIKVYKTDDRAKAQVATELVQASALELHLRPTGPCPAPNEAVLECFEGNVSYTVELTTAIKSGGGRSLYCPLAGDTFNCKRVFITGDQFDNDAPTVAIVNYQSGESVPLGGTAEIRARARDGFGVDTVQYELNDQIVYTSDVDDVTDVTDVTDTFAWDVDPETYRPREAVQVRAIARDVDGHVTASEAVRLIPRPAHCFNRKQDGDETGPDCGGEFCGACAGAACRGNADCAAGVCRVPAGAEVGVCVELPLITDVNPPDGAAGTVVTIEGRYFGAEAGQVVFYKSANEPVAAGNLCGAQWSPDAITVSVPAGLEANKVAVIGVRTKAGDEDRTNDDRGAKFENVFTVNDVTRPGLCAIDPKSGLINDRVTVRGVNIGNGGASGLLFADQPARVDRWDQDRDGQLGEVVGFVPNIGAGAVRVSVQVGDNKSNALPFEIRAFREQDRPNIGSISPDRGPVGTYVTIAGTGFGAAGQGSVVVFEHRASGVNFFADMEFPAECGAGTWNDRLIVAKVPRGVDLGAAAGGVAPYKIQIKRGAAQIPSNAMDFGIAVAGEPAPGICKIDPNMRLTGGMIDIYGENFGNAAGNVVFWDANATPDVASWTAADVRAIGAVWEETGRHVSIKVPEGAVSGPVKVVRQENQAQSNGYDFVVGSCVQNRNQCPSAGQTCCQSGFYTGSCQESCAAGARTAEYSWIFSTGNIPLVPDLVECCGRNCPLANPLPSPSPWNGQQNSQSVCVNAMIRGTFTTNIADLGNQEDNFILEKCSGEDDNPCTDFAEVHTGAVIANGDGHAEFSFSGEHTPNLEPNATYQVRIAEGLIAMPDAEAGRDGGEMRPDPAMVEACGGGRHARGTAYCFRFRTNDRECAIGGVGVVPGAFTAKELGFLVADDDNNVVPELTGDEDPLYRAGVTAAGNSCISLDPARFDWQWQESSRGEVARVLAAGRDGAFTRFIQAIKPSDAPVTISATAVGVTGSGTLLVSPGDPQIIAAWPQCQEACVNVDAGVSFNIPMDAQTLSPLNVQVYKCRNELCKFEDIEADLGSGRIENTIESIRYEDVNDAELPPYEKHRARFIFREQLAVAAFYRVILDSDVFSRDGVTISKLSDDYDFPVEQDGQSMLWKSFTFRVRNDDKPCAIQSVNVQPVEGIVRAIGSQKWFRATAQGEANGCGPNGGAELLNAANMSWAWTAAEPAVVGLETFDVSARPALGCTAQCLLVGSQAQPRLCGNGRLDAGEDCDPANGTWCTDRCLFAGAAAPVCGNGDVDEAEQCDDGNVIAGDGCSEKCLAEGASVTKVTCGNTDIAPGENCDDGNTNSGDGCSPECVKEGTSISEAWCRTQGDDAVERYPACAQSVQSCGNGVLESGEACDPPQAGVCSDRCLLAGGAGKVTCGNGILEIQQGEECDDNNAVSGDGCENCLLRGSSPRYANASMCGDGQVGVGESFRCESAQHGDGRPDPLVLATLQSITGHEQDLQGEGADEARIETEIQAEASYNETTGTGSAKMVLQCGFTQADQCPDPDNYGVGSNGCCYAYPAVDDPRPVGEGACRNPALSFKINSGILSKSLEGNIMIAIERDEPCRAGEIKIAFGEQNTRLATQSWWERFVARVRRTVRQWFVEIANAASHQEPAKAPQRPATCFDGIRNAGELKVDCGGPCGACINMGCQNDGDCVSGNCREFVPGMKRCEAAAQLDDVPVRPESCFNGVRDRNEFRVDCAGPCGACISMACQNDGDCASGNCHEYAPGVRSCSISAQPDNQPAPPVQPLVEAPQRPATCSNAIWDEGEIDIDCGNLCGLCSMLLCQNDAECASKSCQLTDGILRCATPATCFNGLKDKGELKIDCGGLCGFCENQGCENDAQCASKNCQTRNLFLNDATKLCTAIAAQQKPVADGEVFAPPVVPDALPVPQRWCASTLQARYSVSVDDGGTRVSIMPLSLLDPNSRYRVILKGGANGIRDGRNVPLKQDFEWQLSTGPHVCTLDQVRVEPSAWVFSATQQGTGPLCSVDADCGEGGLCVDVAGGQKRCDLSRHRFTARAYTGVGENVREIAPVPDSYDWNVEWGPTNQDSILGVVGDANSALVSTKQGQSGDEIVIAGAKITTDKVNNPPQVNASSTRMVTGVSQVMVSACQRPWPALVGGPPVFPYEDVEGNDDGIGIAPAGMQNIWTNFSMWYCMDGVSAATTTDDLPSLTPQFIQYDKQGSSLLKRFHLLTPDGEAIGMMVRTNPQWLSLADWYENKFPGQGKPRPMAVIDGFEAAQLADTVYVNAVNHNPLNGSLFANVYVISMSGVGRAKPSAALRNIFDQIVKNLKFTVNIDQYNRCAVAVDNQNPDMASPKCSADVECVGDFVGRRCLAGRDKLRRDLTRMNDVQEVLNGLKNYKTQSGNFPRLDEVENKVGSFIPFFTTSKWGSWQSALGNTLSRRLPEDPVNKFIGCSVEDGYDAETCWNGATQTFQCNGGNVYQYRTAPDGTAAEVWMNFEFFDPERQRELGDRIDALASDGVSFREGACVAEGQVMGAGAANCGNQIVEAGEVCDGGQGYSEACMTAQGVQIELYRRVPGDGGRADRFDAFGAQLWMQCRVDCSGFRRTEFPVRRCTLARATVCAVDDDCIYNDTDRGPCIDDELTFNRQCVLPEELPGGEVRSLCGNGILDGNEECDQGALNGRYGGYCNSTCTGATGYCGDRIRQPEELCDHTAPPVNNRQARATWSLARGNTCGWDCQSYGLYCGDGVVTATWARDPAETCDDGNRVAGDGCDADCHVEEVASAVCGNRRKEGAEQCDGGDRCDAQCRLIGAYCGNSFIDAGEVCDNGAQNGVACTGEYNRQCSYCSADCRTVRFASGPYCGDGRVNRPQEICDATDVPGYKCFTPVTTVEDPAALRCKSSPQCAEPECINNKKLCKNGEQCCGNGVVEASEACDGSAFAAGFTCFDRVQFRTISDASKQCNASCTEPACVGNQYTLCQLGETCSNVGIVVSNPDGNDTFSVIITRIGGNGESRTVEMAPDARITFDTLPIGRYQLSTHYIRTSNTDNNCSSCSVSRNDAARGGVGHIRIQFTPRVTFDQASVELNTSVPQFWQNDNDIKHYFLGLAALRNIPIKQLFYDWITERILARADGRAYNTTFIQWFNARCPNRNRCDGTVINQNLYLKLRNEAVWWSGRQSIQGSEGRDKMVTLYIDQAHSIIAPDALDNALLMGGSMSFQFDVSG